MENFIFKGECFHSHCMYMCTASEKRFEQTLGENFFDLISLNIIGNIVPVIYQTVLAASMV